MKFIIINDKKYNLIENYKDGFDIELVKEKLTDYFFEYDYIIGDWAYGKIRLKGFCNKNNPIFKEINDYQKKDKYIKEQCAYDCRYFVLENLEKQKA